MSEFGPDFDRAQTAYDAQEPDDEHDCEKDGHSWKRVRSDADGNVEFKCRYCGETDVI